MRKPNAGEVARIMEDAGLSVRIAGISVTGRFLSSYARAVKMAGRGWLLMDSTERATSERVTLCTTEAQVRRFVEAVMVPSPSKAPREVELYHDGQECFRLEAVA